MKIIKEVLIFTLLMANSAIVYSQSTQIRKLSIEEMFNLADNNSRSIRVFDFAEKESEQAIKVAENAKLPSIDVSLAASYLGDGWIADRDFSNGTNAPMPHLGNNFAIEASQVIYAGGAISSSIALAKLQYQLARLDKEKNRQDIRFLLLGNYLEMYKLRNQEEVYLKNIEQTKQLLSEIQARQKEGLALKNDITRYELQLKSLELALMQVRNSIIILNDQLITVLGLPEETMVEVDASLLSHIPSISNEAQWQQAASNTSPLLQQSKLRVEQSKKYEKTAKSERLPSIALFAANHFDGPITIEVPPINKNFNYWYAGVFVKFNLASLYKSGKSIKQARISTQKAVENDLLLQENIQTEIKAAYIRFVESFTMHNTQMKSLELASQNYDTVNKRYLNDLALITDMLDASNSKLNAELQVANAQINILFNYYKLEKVSGNL
ncbi:TolC family protein [Parabacteroides sp. 52]|uniref:TolC family protein n=1 Tax=unclassified Parabacteroides TaxID=2649774 RepID=UPI0013D3FF68|nr:MULTISPECIES: TolC family protein [unclassified Parabacteroides]MDH6534138.1 outer membrane protein [Parabacteroides sp. PM5-20]NDV54959.1 TolC family protein [Parabacteroides sp. 52]